MAKRTTIVDIARATGFSVSSVSKALTNASDISQKTRNIIKSKARELGYVQNLNAASLKNGSSRIISILCDSFLNPYYNEVIYYLELQLSEMNYTIINYRSNTFDTKIYNNILSRNPDGILSFLTPDKDVEKFLINSNFPIVIIGRSSEYASSVHSDNEKIGNLAADYLIKNNCTSPIYIGEDKDIPIVRQRCEGFINKLKENDIDVKVFFKERNSQIKDLFDKIEIDVLLKCDSIFCFNDIIAFEAMSVLSKLNKSGTLVIGVDNIQEEIPLPFSMVSIGCSKEKIAKDSIQLLLNQINKTNDGIEEIVEESNIYLINY